jgi:hypothetical protein
MQYYNGCKNKAFEKSSIEFFFITVWGQDSTNFAPGISILVEYLIQDFVSE